MPEVDATADVARLFSGQRLRLAREIRSMTQSDLAADHRVTVTSAAISQFEKGSPKPRQATVEQLAAVLEFPVSFFAVSAMPSSRPGEPLERLDGHGHFRSLRSVSAKQRRESLSVTQLVRDLLYALTRRVRLPEPDVPRARVGEDEIDAVAAEVRRSWKLDDGPIDDVLMAAERHGVVAIRHHICDPVISAYSVPFPERPVLVLPDKGAKRDRDRFSASHEIGHLVLHEPGTSLAPKDVERQAHRFASAFLMPADQIRAELPATLDWVAFIELKQRWQVSIASLLRRSRDLDVLPEDLYTHGMRTINARGWRTNEPGALGAPESPRLLAEAMGAAGMTPDQLADDTGWPRDLVAPILAASTDPRPAVTL